MVWNKLEEICDEHRSPPSTLREAAIDKSNHGKVMALGGKNIQGTLICASGLGIVGAREDNQPRIETLPTEMELEDMRWDRSHLLELQSGCPCLTVQGCNLTRGHETLWEGSTKLFQTLLATFLAAERSGGPTDDSTQ